MKKYLICFIGLYAILGGSIFSNAEETSAGGYTIEGVTNSHQIDKNAGYFDLHEQPGETDELKVKLINQSSQEKTLQIRVTNSNTNSNGLIDYTGTLKDHRLLSTPLTSILKVSSDTVKVPANSEVETVLTLHMPSKKQEGIILGGIVVSESENQDEQRKELSVKNTYSYTLGVVLKNDAQTPTKANVSVELEDVNAILASGKKVVQASIVNPHPYIFGEATVKGTIKTNSDHKVVQEQTAEHVSIAPYSVYPFQFDWKKAELKPGEYQFEGIVKTSEKEWKLSKKFKITEKQADKINKESVFKVYIPLWLKASSIFFFVITVLSTVWVSFRKL
ncbi:DUF916 and DUF3324 domain-containing protein [Enterococcus faecalis]|uniref:DUF916 and DUF3324 domain-containing protein n=1 Tax=Enterococcus faecalis TaxID=1351 RepID=UPI0025AEF6B3|nr:DUF916 and DUF3324 domain-containing protein [Enterococcus faecalis]MDN3202355.1 DUF916 and DUF3324 domain-containing protein [Enterococcus faecalis]